MKPKLKTFYITYYFDGYGNVKIEAENEEQAKDLFDERDWEGENEYSENTCLDSIEEVK